MINAALEGGVLVRLRNEDLAILFGKGVIGRVNVGRSLRNRDPLTWNLEGRWRWDGQDHPLDIVEQIPQ